MAISEAQRATRRRALGRKLINCASGIQVVATAPLTDNPDLQFLTTAEKKAVDKQLKALDVVISNFSKLGDRLEDK